MNVVDNITESLKYPFNDWVKIVILAVITIIPIVNFISIGYYLRIIKSTLAGIDEIPEFDDVGELFIDGLKVLIVGIIYMIVPLILFLLAFVFAGPATTYSSTYLYYSMPAFTGVSFVFLFIGWLLSIIISIIAYMGIANMAYYDGDLGAALRFSEILDRIAAIGWGDYILWLIALWVTLIIAGVIIGVVGAILLLILIGILVFFLGEAYLMMFQGRSVALTFANSLE
jgi:hypothetical protein